MADVFDICTGSSKLADNTSFELDLYSGEILAFGVVGGVRLMVMCWTSSAETTEPDEPVLCTLSRRLRRRNTSWSGMELFDRLEPLSRLEKQNCSYSHTSTFGKFNTQGMQLPWKCDWFRTFSNFLTQTCNLSVDCMSISKQYLW